MGHRRRGTGSTADVLDPLASPSSPRRMGRGLAQACDHTLIVVSHDAVIRPLPNQHCARSVCPTCRARWFPPWSPSTAMTATAARAWPATTTNCELLTVTRFTRAAFRMPGPGGRRGRCRNLRPEPAGPFRSRSIGRRCAGHGRPPRRRWPRPESPGSREIVASSRSDEVSANCSAARSSQIRHFSR